jgi:hypothetical protein
VCVFDDTNYNYKLHFKNLSIYHIPRVCRGTLAAENLDLCTACDTWDNNIQLTLGKDRRQQIYVLLLISKSWGCCRPARNAFPTQRHMWRGGVIYFCQPFLLWMMPSMDGWQDGRMDGKLHEKRPLCTGVLFQQCLVHVLVFFKLLYLCVFCLYYYLV